VDGIVIEDDLEEGELIDLFSCCDVYVSLHRSEGFGYGIAEAMALGKPVVVTAYSGNIDFATAGNSCQVGYRIREITQADHIFGESSAEVYRPGSLWADPDIDQAARWMQLLASDPSLRRTIGEAGRDTISNNYSASPVIDAVVTRLVQIRKAMSP
jgi:glycosyltransferase involved in cell wall biosynthesis